MKIEIPTNCPSCESKLERVKDQLFCRNPDCGQTQIKKVVNYAKVMRIKGLGERTIERLGLANIPDIYSLTLSAAVAAIGEKMAAKLIGEIENSKNTTLDKFLAACSIPLIGQTAGTKLSNVAQYPFEINTEICKKAGLGDKATSNLVSWLEREYMEKLVDLPLVFKESSPPAREGDIVVCITGKIPGYTKAKLAEYLADFNVKVVATVSKKVNYLLCAENKNSTKEQKATELGIKILNLEELIKEIN